MKKGSKASLETKLKMSLAKKGKRKTPEAIEKIRLAALARWANPEWANQRHIELARENSNRVCKLETREKRSQNRLGKLLSDETKSKISQALSGNRNPFYGKHHSPEVLEKISRTSKGRIGFNRGKHLSKETKQRIAISHLGKKLSDEHKRNIGRASLGHKHTDETKERLRIINSGPANHSWRGGRGHPQYGSGWSSAREKTITRDHGLCILCNEIASGTKKSINVHHIIKVYDCRLRGIEPHFLSNLACLCHKHHPWAEHHENESIPLLQKILSERFGYSYYQGIPDQIETWI